MNNHLISLNKYEIDHVVYYFECIREFSIINGYKEWITRFLRFILRDEMVNKIYSPLGKASK